MKPVRIQRSRKKGSRLESPNGLPVICVTRPSRWGNPYPVSWYGNELALALFRDTVAGAWNPTLTDGVSETLQKWAYAAHCKFRERIGMHPGEAVRLELRGCNLACFCPIGSPCHADVLLEMANA